MFVQKTYIFGDPVPVFDWGGPSFDSWTGPGQVDVSNFPYIKVSNINSAGPATLVLQFNTPPTNNLETSVDAYSLTVYTGEAEFPWSKTNWSHIYNTGQPKDPNFRYLQAFIAADSNTELLGTDQVVFPSDNFGTIEDFDESIYEFNLNINGCSMPGMLMTPRNADMAVDKGDSPTGSPIFEQFISGSYDKGVRYRHEHTFTDGTLVPKWSCDCVRQEAEKDAVESYTGPNAEDDWHVSLEAVQGGWTTSSTPYLFDLLARPIGHADVDDIEWEFAGGKLKRKTTTEDYAVTLPNGVNRNYQIVAEYEFPVTTGLTVWPTNVDWEVENYGDLMKNSLAKSLCALDRRFLQNQKYPYSRYKDKTIKVSGKVTHKLKQWTGDDIWKYGYSQIPAGYRTKTPSRCTTDFVTTGKGYGFQWIQGASQGQSQNSYLGTGRIMFSSSYSTNDENVDPADDNLNVYIDVFFGRWVISGHSDDLRVRRSRARWGYGCEAEFPEISRTASAGSIASGAAVTLEWELVADTPADWHYPNQKGMDWSKGYCPYIWYGTLKINGTTIIDNEPTSLLLTANDWVSRDWPQWKFLCDGIQTLHRAKGALGYKRDYIGDTNRVAHIARDIGEFSELELNMEIIPLSGTSGGPGIP